MNDSGQPLRVAPLLSYWSFLPFRHIVVELHAGVVGVQNH